VSAGHPPSSARVVDAPVAGWTQVWMDTLVTIQLAVPPDQAARWAPLVERAFAWFAATEATCSRFDPHSELAGLTRAVGHLVPASPILRQALRFALALAEATGGAFDPTIGARLEAAGLDRDYRSGHAVRLGAQADPAATWRDVDLDLAAGTITLRRPLLLDLGAIAKGLAVDLAAAELAAAPGVVVNAGGDAYLHGHDPAGRPWRVGIADPHQPGQLIAALDLHDQAIATSGNYARHASNGQPHILDPHPPPAADRSPQRGTGRPAPALASVSVIAPTALLADGLSTAAMAFGPAGALDLLAHTPTAEALLVSADGARLTTAGLPRLLAQGRGEVMSQASRQPTPEPTR
jgi:FAD:protein FMN transferase